MRDQTDTHDSDTNSNGDSERAVGPVQPLIRPSSGLYQWSLSLDLPQPTPIPIGPAVPLQPGGGSAKGLEESTDELAELQSAALTMQREELRLDVDGLYPQNTASGSISGLKVKPVNWIAKLKHTGVNTYAGGIWFKDGNVAAFPYTKVQITVTKPNFPTSATVKFSGGGTTLTRTYQFKSPYFRKVEFECDHAQGVSNATSFNTGSHPNRPASLPVETLTVQKIYRRAGFDVHTTAGNTVPISLAGANSRWSDGEMHDAMQVYWSHFANKAQWSFWTLFASMHEQGSSLGGIMFDDIGPNERQGTSIFVDSFISQAPAGDPAPGAFAFSKSWTVADSAEVSAA